MNARTIRRAQERRAAKQARKAALTSQGHTVADCANVQSNEAAVLSAPKLQANEAAVLSAPKLQTNEAAVLSAPKVQTNEAVVVSVPRSQVVKGLTGRTVLVPADETEPYARLIAAFIAKWQPVGAEEHRLVQALVDTEWRLMRIPSLEAGIYALGRLEFAETFNHERDEVLRQSLIEAQIFVVYQRQLNNLAIQENRLRRQRQKDSAELQHLQQERLQRPSHAEEIGFEFQPSSPGEVGNASPVTSAVPATSCYLLPESDRKHVACAEQPGFDERGTGFHLGRGLLYRELLQFAEH